jgi:predicted nucleic acid-binding protein
MRFALDTSLLVAFFLEDDKLHAKAVDFVGRIFRQEIDYACVSAINIAEMGYVVERATEDEDYSYNCMFAIYNEMPLDVIPVTWDFITALAHLKAVNAISFCDNATIAAAKLTKSKALFTREKEIVSKANITGAEIVFLEEFRK